MDPNEIFRLRFYIKIQTCQVKKYYGKNSQVIVARYCRNNSQTKGNNYGDYRTSKAACKLKWITAKRCRKG